MDAGTEIRLQETLKELKLPTTRKVFEEVARQAESEGWDYETYLLETLSREVSQRRENQYRRRLQEASFPQLKPLEEADLNKWPGFEARDVSRLASGSYLEKRENVIFLGKHGTGKTHAALSLGLEACRQGHRVKFLTAATLVTQLLEARDEKQLKNYLRRLSNVRLLILDELGYIPFSKDGGRLLFQVLSERYEHSSTLITSNLKFSEWTSIFGDENLTAALLDRLTHHCSIQDFNWESIRFSESLKNREALH